VDVIEAVKIETYDRLIIALLYDVAIALGVPSLTSKIGVCRRVWDYGIGLALPWRNGTKPDIKVMPFADMVAAYPRFGDLKVQKPLMLVVIIDSRGDADIYRGLARLEKELLEYEYLNLESAGFFYEDNGLAYDFEDGSRLMDKRLVLTIEIDDFHRSGEGMAG